MPGEKADNNQGKIVSHSTGVTVPSQPDTQAINASDGFVWTTNPEDPEPDNLPGILRLVTPTALPEITTVEDGLNFGGTEVVSALRKQVAELEWERNGLLVLNAELIRQNAVLHMGTAALEEVNDDLQSELVGMAEREATALALAQAETQARIEAQQREAEALDAANHDDLTKLLRNGPWGERVEELLARGETVGIVSMDLNKLKSINDTFGHAIGDIVLIAMAEVLQRKDDMIEYGDGEVEDTDGELLAGRGERSDEFHAAVLIPTSPDPRRNTDPQASMESLVTYLKDKMERKLARFMGEVERLVQDRLDDPDEVQAQGLLALGFGVSVGYALYAPGDPRTLAELLHEADLSMYEDKRQAHERFTAQQKQIGGLENSATLRTRAA